MMLDEVFKIIDQLTPEQQQVKWYIDHRPESLRSEIDQLLATAQPTDLKAGTMDINRLMQVAQAMWNGLDDTEIEAVVQAMNEEYIKQFVPVTAIGTVVTSSCRSSCAARKN